MNEIRRYGIVELLKDHGVKIVQKENDIKNGQGPNQHRNRLVESLLKW